MGKNTVQTKAWLDKCYPDSAPSRQMVEKWIADFKRGRATTSDAERSGRPKEAVTSENIRKIHKIILNNRKVKLSEIADTLKISTERVHHIVHEYLGMRKLCAKWVPRELTFDQKQQRVDDSEQCLELFNRNKSEFLRRYYQWMKHGSITTHPSQIGSQHHGQQATNRVHNAQKRNSRLARLWRLYFGMRME